MRRIVALSALSLACASPQTQAPAPAAPYKVVTRAKVGGEGGTDYIYADAVGRRLYIPRGGTRAVPATETSPAQPAVPGRITVFDLETLAPLGEIPGTGGNGVAVDPRSGHGFSSSKPVSMFDTKTLTLMKQIDVGAAQPDGILFDSYNDRVYIFSHPTKDAIVIDSHDGKVLSTVLTLIKSTLGRNRNYEASITSRDTWLNLSTCRMLAQQQVLAASGRGFRGED